MASKRNAGLFSNILSSLKEKWSTGNRIFGNRISGNRISRSNARSLQIETFEKRHLLASVTGAVLEDLTGNGPSADDLPMGDVAVELYRDADGNGLFDENVDLFIGGQDSDPTTGAYAFDGLSDGRYFLRQITPDGFHHVGGPEVITFDVAGSIVGMLVDDFWTPDPHQVYNISDEYSAPLMVETDSSGILGGQRDLLVEIDGDPTTVSTQLLIGADHGLRLASASPGTTITLQYDGLDVDPTDQLSVGQTFADPVDLTAGGTNTGLRIDFDMVEAGLSASEMDIRITATGKAGSAEYVGAIPEASDPSFFVPFSSFMATGGFSFAALVGLQVVLNESAESDVDFSLNAIIAENPDSDGFDFANFAGHSVSGVKVEDLTGDGFSEDDQPLGGVTIQLYGDTDGDRQFDDTKDALLATTTTEPGTGAYAFDGLADGRYFIREVVPAAMSQTDGLEVYTLDISGEFVGLLIDDFAAPEAIEVLQIEDTHLNPTLLESSAAAILGGQRDLLVDVLGDATTVSAQVQIGGADGLKLASSSPGTLVALQYDGLDTDPADALSVGNTFDTPIDLTGGGTNTGLRIDFDVLEAGIGATEMDFRVLATSLGGSAELSDMLPESADHSYFLPFKSFAATGTFSFAELTSLQFMFNENGTEDVDFTINAILAENPDSAGFDFANHGDGSAIDIEKSTNGEDADLGPGPEVAVGDTVTWVYTITNTGYVDLFYVNVIDDQVASLTLTDSGNGDDILSVGEVWIYQAIGTAIEGQYANLATVTAMDSHEQNVSDEDPSHYFGVTSVPDIDIEKSTNDVDADLETGPLVPVGDSVIWTYTVTNTGNTDLFNVVVTDDQGLVPVLITAGDPDDVLNVGETWVFTAMGTAEEGQYANLATVTAMDSREQEVSDEDPSHYFGVASSIDIEKSTNGQDADIEMGPIIAVGNAVTWRYVVTNMGNVDLFDVVVIDDQGEVPTFISGDDGDLVLNVGEKWIFEAIGTATEGQYANLSTVTALDVLQNQVTDKDPSHYFGVVSGIDIEKSTNGEDADTETGPIIAVGDVVTWTYTVTNMGNFDLFNVVVTDDQGVIPTLISGDDGDLVLNVGEKWIFEAAGTAIEGQYANLSTVIALDILEQQVTDEDPSHYFGATPGIDIEKSTNGEDADTETGPLVAVGQPVIWTYTVTNTGNFDLFDVVVIDDQGEIPTFISGDDGDLVLNVGEKWIFEAIGTAIEGQYANLGSVTALDVFQSQVTDEDPSHYFGVLPEIDIEKSTNGEDADTGTGPFVAVGGDVIWTYTVTNTGNVDLFDIVVTDDQGLIPSLTNAGDSDDVLNVGETWVFTAAGLAEEGQYANLATVTAIDILQQPVSDEDPSHYFGFLTEIDIEKWTNGQDADTPTGPQVIDGFAVVWDYFVTNTGNVVLIDIAVTDDNGTPGDTSDDFSPTFFGGDGNGNGKLDPGETWSFQATGAPVMGQYGNEATVVAADPFGQTLNDTDPSHYFGIAPAIDIEKATNGQDADTPTGPMIPVGETVTWTYVVTNPGTVALDDVQVTDDNGTPADTSDDFILTLASGDTNGDGRLDPDETWKYETTGTAGEGQYGNIAEVEADFVVVGAAKVHVGESDPSHYFGISSGIDVEKATNGHDADTQTGPLVASGDQITWTYVVINKSNGPLDNVILTDDQGVTPIFQSGDDNNDGVLDTSETWLYEATGTAVAGQYANLATVTAKDISGAEVGDQDPSHYFGTISSIDIEKATNGQDADTPTGPMVSVGGTVTWTYAVTNTGNVALSNVDVSDDQGVTPVFQSGDNGNSLLDPGETWIYRATGTATAGQYDNMGAVTAIDPRQTQVVDEDPSHYFGYTASIDIEKSTNGQDADSPTGPLVAVGELITWLYEVTNTGNVGLDDVVVTDNQGVFPTYQSGDDGDGVLDPSETWIFRATGIATAGQYGNLGTVVAKGPEGAQVTDEDPSHYFGVTSGIDIEKSTNGQDADSPQGPIVAVGDPVTWTYNVTNTGNVDLSNVVVTDDQGVVPGLISSGNGDAILDIGETWTYRAAGTAVEGQYANLGTVTAIDPLQQQVADEDPSHYFGEAPSSSSLSGYVYNDVNNDGFFAKGVEQPIPNTKVILVGSDSDGVAINKDTTADADGYYEFTDLPAGTYRLLELQPSAYNDGKDTIGTPGGLTANDEFSKIELPADFEGKENNFGERGLKPEYSSKQYLLWPGGTWGLTYDGHNSDPVVGPISPQVYAANTAVSPRTTPIVGTPGDDLLEVYAGEWTAKLNGEVIELDPQSTSLQFDGFDGEDTVILHGTDGDDSVTLDADGVKLVGSNYTITVTDAEKITVDGHGGSNRAVIHDSRGHDLLKAKASWAQLSGEGFEHTLWGFSDLQATATEGYDVVMIYDSPGDDRLVAYPTNATFSGDGFELKFDYFNGLHAYGTAGGHDVAELYDSAADDTFVADAKHSALFAPGYYNRAKYFEEVIAHATTGNDQAWLFDSAGNDLLEAADDWARLTIAGRTAEIDGFSTVRADSSQGGQDNKNVSAVDFLMFTDGPWLDQ